MPNMSYCRFENTLQDLRDCERAMNDGALDDPDTSQYEKEASEKLIKLCKRIADDYAD